ncbi:MAG TPA: DUF1223 domain-containing protein [Hellea balneolensis]|uniref:DUF1223 domain-containing protein n=1 Tax=Hellea balneolensis TaxID=287478 RepID=A0A7C3GCS7_9PROT|nr:DUF1223 domain-containing protein [Hellea balneolensis]
MNISASSSLYKYVAVCAAMAMFAVVFAIGGSAAPSAAPSSTKIAAHTSPAVQPTTIVELFTSQGCASCPPANKFLATLLDDPNVLTLSYSIDYWDYLGWKDTFGKSEFSARQRTYGQQWGGRVYTPQMVVNGEAHSKKFTKRQLLKHRLPKAGSDPASYDIKIVQADDKIEVSIPPTNIPPKGAVDNAVTVSAVRYIPGLQTVSVKRGENKGRDLVLSNIVTQCDPIGTWNGAKEFSTQIDALATGEALVVLVQTEPGGPIVAAVQF